MLPAFSESPVTIAVVLSRDIAPYRAALKGFEEHLKREKRSYKLAVYSVEVFSHDPGSLIDRIQAKGPELILTLGSAATDFIGEQVRETPIVFSLVLPSSGRNSLEVLSPSSSRRSDPCFPTPSAWAFCSIPRSRVPSWTSPRASPGSPGSSSSPWRSPPRETSCGAWRR
jgi:hypothetical protein